MRPVGRGESKHSLLLDATPQSSYHPLMLAPAFYHKTALSAARAKVATEPRFMWWTNSSFLTYELDIKDQSWAGEQWVSLDGDAVTGFLGANIDRDVRRVTQLSIARLTDSPVFHLDLVRFLRSLRRYRAVAWTVVVGNPVEAQYDSICARLGGRIVGTFRQSARLWDGRLYDEKHYEWVNGEYRE